MLDIPQGERLRSALNSFFAEETGPEKVPFKNMYQVPDTCIFFEVRLRCSKPTYRVCV